MTDLDPLPLDSQPAVQTEPKPLRRGDSHPWIRGAVISAVGVVIGMLALGLFCYSLGVNFSEEGWSETRQPHQGAMVVSLVGFSVATLLFWIGFIQLTHARVRDEG